MKLVVHIRSFCDTLIHLTHITSQYFLVSFTISFFSLISHACVLLITINLSGLPIAQFPNKLDLPSNIFFSIFISFYIASHDIHQLLPGNVSGFRNKNLVLEGNSRQKSQRGCIKSAECIKNLFISEYTLMPLISNCPVKAILL